MTKFKAVFAALVFLAIVFVPNQSVSKEKEVDTVTFTAKNLLVLNGEVNGDSVGDLIVKGKELVSATTFSWNKCHLYLFLNSPGGNIQSGFELIEFFQGLGCEVDTVTLFSASMSFQISQNLGTRYILKSGANMSHHAAGEMSGSFGGKSTNMDSRYKFWLDRVRELDEQTVKRTNGKQTYETYTSQYDHELWMTGTESVHQGYSDKAVVVKCDNSLKGVTTKHANFFGMDISYDLDLCPINTNPMNVKVAVPEGKTVLTQAQIEEAKTRFLEHYETKARQVIPMYW